MPEEVKKAVSLENQTAPGQTPQLPQVGQTESTEEKIQKILEAGVALVLLYGTNLRAMLTPSGLECLSGELEALSAETLQIAQECLMTGRSRFAQKIFCEVLRPEQSHIFKLAAETLHNGNKGVWTVDLTEENQPQRTLLLSTLPEYLSPAEQTLVSSGLVRADLEAALPLLKKLDNKPGFLLLDQQTIYVEALEASPILLLCGVNTTLVATAKLARQCGFIVDVAATAEPAFLEKRFTMARHRFSLPDFEDLIETCSINSRHYVVIMTGSVSMNTKVLRQILSSHAFYVGMHGDAKEWRKLQTTLRLEGFPTMELAAVRCPVGLAIDGKTATRRAVAIVAEMLAAQAGTLQRLRNI